MDYPEQGLGDQDWCHVTLTRLANFSIRMQQQEGGHEYTQAPMPAAV